MSQVKDGKLVVEKTGPTFSVVFVHDGKDFRCFARRFESNWKPTLQASLASSAVYSGPVEMNRLGITDGVSDGILFCHQVQPRLP